MYPSRRGVSALAVLFATLNSLLSSNGVYAGPLIERADSPATATATPATVTDVASLTSSVAHTGTASKSDKPAGDLFPECHQATGPLAPFCQPTDDSEVYVGETYYVTWDADYFAINSTITVGLNYVNASGGGASAWTSEKTLNRYGFVTITMDKSWLQGNDFNNLTFFLTELDPNAEVRATFKKGPTVWLGHRPMTHYAPSPTTGKPNHLGLVVGLPVSLGFVALVVIGLMFGMRKHRHIGLGNVMGRRKGYGIGKSRRQRMKSGKKGGIMLGEREIEPIEESIFRDEPAVEVELPMRNGHAREVSLGSLVDSPGREEFSDTPTHHTNAFRDEVERQRGR